MLDCLLRFEMELKRNGLDWNTGENVALAESDDEEEEEEAVSFFGGS